MNNMILQQRTGLAGSPAVSGVSDAFATTPRFAGALVIIYMHLWIVEGALRKWVPGLEQILYFARDGLTVIGLVIAVLFLRLRRRKTGIGLWLFILFAAILSGLQVMIGLVPLGVGLVGLRSYIAPLLLVYIVWCYGCGDLLRGMSKVTLLYAPIELVIAVAQVMSTKTSWINKEVGADAAYFVNGTVVRASGTFSAPSGLTLFIPLSVAICLGILHGPRSRLHVPAIIGLVSSVGVTVLSGARGTVLATGLVLGAYIIYQLMSLRAKGFRNAALIVILTSAVYLFTVHAFPDVFRSFVARFDNAAQAEDSGDRILNQIFDFAVVPIDVLGDGAGSHSMAGMALGAPGPWIETESIRWVAEMGLLGWLMGAGRIVLCAVLICLIGLTLRRLSLVTVLLASCLIPVVLYGHVTQFPTAQGFFSICLSMLIIAGRAVGPDVSAVPRILRPS